MKNIDLQRELKYPFIKLKNRKIRFKSMEKSKGEFRKKKLFVMREKIIKSLEIVSNYDSKWKFNAK